MKSLMNLAFFGSGLLFLSCYHGECGCTPAPPPPYSISGRLTNSQGAPLSGVEVSAVSLIKPDALRQPPVGVLSSHTKTLSDQDGRYTLHVSLGAIRVFSRPLVGSVVYSARVSPELKFDDSRPLISGLDFVFTSTPASAIGGTISPIRNSNQDDDLSLSQIHTIDGIDYEYFLSNQKPSLSGSTERFLFPLQSGGSYYLFLSRSETTGTHAQSGTARSLFTLPEGNTSDVTLAVK